MDKITVFDTTLRDGEQSPGCSMHLEEKVEMAKELERLRVDVLEAGFAASSKEDFDAIKAIVSSVKASRIAVLSRANESDVSLAAESLSGADNGRLHVFIATSPLHMQMKLRMSPEEVLEKIKATTRFARNLVGDVQFSFEDATRSDREFLLRCTEAAIKEGATTINFPDTVGYVTPYEICDLMQYVRNNVPNIDKVVLATHNHNDLGQAVANTLAAVVGGARQVDVTVNGIGERAGNAALEEVVMALETRKDFFKVQTGIDTTRIYGASKLLSAITGNKIPRNKAIVGKNAFAHEAGIHQHGIINSRETYEIIRPESVGVPENKIVLGKHSGKHAIIKTLADMGYQLTDAEANEIYEKFMELVSRKKDVTQKDLEALISHKRKVVIKNGFKLVEYVITSVSSLAATAMIKLEREGEAIEKTCRGDGPVDAAFKAINEIAGRNFDLVDYSLNAVTEGEDALGEAIIRLESDGKNMLGRAVSTDIIEASVLGYINAVNKIMFS